METERIAFVSGHLMGEPAARSIARPGRRLAVLLLLAGNGHAASSRLARQRPERTLDRAQLRFLG